MPAFVPRLSEYSPTDMHEPNPWWWSTGNVYYENNPLPNCTCYCYGRVGEILGNFLTTVPHDYAGEWWNLATDMPKGQTPKLGAIACYGEGTYYGHVSIVEQINSDGSIVTSNSGYPTTFFWTETLYPENNYIASWMLRYSYVFQGFLYIDEQEQSVSPYVLSAICGNWKQESNVNPGLWENLSAGSYTDMFKGFGLGQWTNTGSDSDEMRLLNLHNYVSQQGIADGDAEGQLEFFLHEAYWHNISSSAYASLSDFLASTSTNIGDLVSEFMLHWEVINDGTYQVRLNAANDFYNYITQHASDDPTTYTWVSKNEYLTEQEILNNVMCIYFWFGGTSPPVPPEPPEPTTGHKLKVWQMIKPRWQINLIGYNY